MICLKHLAREFDIAPYKLRQILRKQFGKSQVPHKYRRWKWDDHNDPELTTIRGFLGSRSKGSSRLHKAPTPSVSAQSMPIASARAHISATASTASQLPKKTHTPTSHLKH